MLATSKSTSGSTYKTEKLLASREAVWMDECLLQGAAEWVLALDPGRRVLWVLWASALPVFLKSLPFRKWPVSLVSSLLSEFSIPPPWHLLWSESYPPASCLLPAPLNQMLTSGGRSLATTPTARVPRVGVVVSSYFRSKHLCLRHRHHIPN